MNDTNHSEFKILKSPRIINATPVLEILLIEDDLDLSALIMEYLELEAMHCDNAVTGVSGLKLAKRLDSWYDCIILDINLPLMDGISLCKELRKSRIFIPIIMLTARDKLDDKLEGFSAGANDYLCKPFEMEELVARIRALSQHRFYDDKFQCGDLIMDLKTKSVRRGNININLTQIEYKILHLLLAYSPQIVNKQKIMFAIWGDEPPESDSLKVHIHNLRKCINLPNTRPLLITIPGHGYLMSSE